MAKKAFDLSRDSIYVADPDDLCIVGGSILPTSERGSIDTAEDSTHSLYDGERLRIPLDDAFVANIDAYGVIQPIVIAKRDDVPVVVAGRTRVRAARLANIARRKRGEPPITVRCAMRRVDDNGLTGAMIAENAVRRDDDVISKMAKAKAYLARGVSEDYVALTFGIQVATLHGWLSFDDRATSETKAAVAAGRVSQTAAATLARIEDPDRQSAELAKLIAGKGSASAAKRALASTKGASVALGKRQIVKLLEVAAKPTHPSATEVTEAYRRGFEHALRAVLGEDVTDRRGSAIVETANL